MVNVEEIRQRLTHIRNRNTGVSVVDMGLISDITEPEEGNLVVRMMRVPPPDPLSEALAEFQEEAAIRVLLAVSQMPGVNRAQVDMVREPSWGRERMTGEAQTKMQVSVF